MVFDNGNFSAHRVKTFFISNLWSEANLYSVDKTTSLLDFFYLGWVVGKTGCICRLVGAFFLSFLLCFFLLFSPGYPLVYPWYTSW